MGKITDASLLKNVIEKISIMPEIGSIDFEHPVDDTICNNLKTLLKNISRKEDDFQIFLYMDDIKVLWRDLIEKSVKCLRYHDKNEPFLDNVHKKPIVYGIEELDVYFKNYFDFEDMLYGSNKYYRDHIVHVFRVWLLGMYCMFLNDSSFLSKVTIAPSKFNKNTEINSEEFHSEALERISIWTIIALAHDLGYPLEKAQKIIAKTMDMMGLLITRPIVNVDLSFDGIQTNMNDFILRLMSSRMTKKKNTEQNDDDEKIYTARLQPKFYFKLQKALDRNYHGVISSIIIYKLLMYFIESEFSIHEDYGFTHEEARQFYIKREILRSIAAHTCRDIYQMNLYSFSFLLIICDDCQEWGRKRISNLYMPSNVSYELESISMDNFICEISDIFNIKNETNDKKCKEIAKGILESIYGQFIKYKTILREGPDTNSRDFLLNSRTLKTHF